MRLLSDALEPRRLLSAAPSISVPATITVPAGKTIQVPISGDADSTLDYDADPSGGLTTSFHGDSNPWLELSTDRGVMRFQLFADLAPNTVRKIRGLVDSGFYDGLSFDRVVDVNGYRFAQGGSPDGTTAGKAAFTFDDEFNADALFDYTGQLAMANSGKDTNSCQFFVTGGTARGFDFNNTIFGQMTRGSKALESILSTADGNVDPAIGTPTDTTTIRSARIVTGVNDAVLQIRAGSKPSTRTVTVTAVDADGNEVEQTIKVKVVPDTTDTPPILKAPDSPIVAEPGEQVQIPIEALDLEGGDYDITGQIVDNGTGSSGSNGVASSYIDSSNHLISITIADNWQGAIRLKVGVKGPGAVYRGSITTDPGDDVRSLKIFDTQEIVISVGGAPIERVHSVGTVTSRLHQPINDKTVLATFDGGGDAQTSDYSATVDWGDGAVTGDAKIEQVDSNTFAVVADGGHTYGRTSDGLPITVAIDGTNGSHATTTATAVVVRDQATLADDGTLTILGTAVGDDVRLSTSNSGGPEDEETLSVRYNGGDANATYDFDFTKVRQIVVQLLAGDDSLQTVDADGLPAMSVDGGDGNDTLFGGDGDDTIVGGAGADLCNGNGGDDEVHGGDGKDTLYGGAGKNALYGENDDDRLIGGGGRDLVNGGDGNDRLYGRNGDDTIEGGGGTDRLYGEAGNDLLIGGSSNDRLYGGDDDDTLYGNAGNDVLNGGHGTNARGAKDSDDAGDTLIDLVG